MADQRKILVSTDAVILLQPLTWLKGIWRGEGKASFPTHKTYEYENSMKFKLIEKAFEKEPLIHFEEIAWVREDNQREFKHWETGYFKPEAHGIVQLYLCHNTGRIEVTYGKFVSLDTDLKTFILVFESASIRNDKGTKVALKSRREIVYKDDLLQYTLEMSTADIPVMTHHLRAEMSRK